MKTRRLSTILTSAYLSAMLASSVAPVRSDATLASTIDPQAARQAFQSAVNGLDASGWTGSATAEIASPEPAMIAYYRARPTDEPVMTPELMARIIKLAQEQTEVRLLSKNVCFVFKLCDGKADMQVKLLETDNPAGHFFAMPLAAGSTDIVIVKMLPDGSLEAYLTDKSYKLRSAAVSTTAGATLVPNDKAAEKFKAELNQFAKEASVLPPTGGTSVASTGAGS